MVTEIYICHNFETKRYCVCKLKTITVICVLFSILIQIPGLIFEMSVLLTPCSLEHVRPGDGRYVSPSSNITNDILFYAPRDLGLGSTVIFLYSQSRRSKLQRTKQFIEGCVSRGTKLKKSPVGHVSLV